MANIFQRAGSFLSQLLRRGPKTKAETKTKPEIGAEPTKEEKRESDIAKINLLSQGLLESKLAQSTVGIFRTSEETKDVNDLLKNSASELKKLSANGNVSPAMAAVLIKKLVRELDPPILPEETQKELIKLAQQNKEGKINKQDFLLAILKEVSAVSPASNPIFNGNSVLDNIIEAMLSVSSPNGEVGTKMTFKNLGVVMGPNLFLKVEPQITGQDPMAAMKVSTEFAELQQSLIQALLEQAEISLANSQQNPTLEPVAEVSALEVAPSNNTGLSPDNIEDNEELSDDFNDFINERASRASSATGFSRTSSTQTLDIESENGISRASSEQTLNFEEEQDVHIEVSEDKEETQQDLNIVEPEVNPSTNEKKGDALLTGLQNHPLLAGKIEAEIAAEKKTSTTKTAMDIIRERVEARSQEKPSSSPRTTEKSAEPLDNSIKTTNTRT